MSEPSEPIYTEQPDGTATLVYSGGEIVTGNAGEVLAFREWVEQQRRGR